MRPTASSLGQGPRLIAGLRRRHLVGVDASAFSELQKPAQDPGPVARIEMPVRDISDVTKGLGLSYEAERDLTRAVEQWMGAPDPVQFRGRLIRGMRGFAPQNLPLRSEVWRRASALYRSQNPAERRRPGSVVIQKSQSDSGGDDWRPMPGITGGLRRAVPGGYEYRFPAADPDPRPDPELARVLSTRAVPQAPELLFCYPDDEPLAKGAGHKYLKRVPTGKQRPRYRYVYKLPRQKGLVVDEHLVAGAKFKVSHAGKLGHFEVLSHDEKKGLVQLKHDESGRTAWIKKRDLQRMLEAHHNRAGRQARAEVDDGKRAAPEALQRVQMGDLARGEWSEVVGFESTAEAAADLALGLKAGWDYAAIKQPAGFMVVARKTPGAHKSARQIVGSKVKVHLRGEDPLSASYVLVEADDVIASHDPVNFNVRRDYPEGVQEREYHRSTHEQMKVIGIAQAMEPVFVVNNNPDGVNGTPIVTPDGVVLGGNARTMGIQRAYAQNPKSAEKYRNHLIAHARDYGFSAANVRGMKAPVLVRRTKVKKGASEAAYTDRLRRLGRRMNEGLTQGLDPRVEEVALGKNFINEKVLRALTDRIEEGQSLDHFLQTEASRPFVHALWASGVIDGLNASQFTHKNALLNRAGRSRVERVLVGSVIDSPQLLDGMAVTQRQAIANSVAHILAAKQSGWDITKDLKRAIEIDQSIQKMPGQFGTGPKALKKFLSGKQKELPGVSSMAGEVHRSVMLRNLLVIVREKAGTRTMPRDFLGFSLRARADARNNPELTGQTALFGGAFAPPRQDPAEALDIEFGVSAAREKEKETRERAARQAKREEKERQAQHRKQVELDRRRRGYKTALEQDRWPIGLAASMGMDPPDLIKAATQSRLVTRVVDHVELLVDAAVATSMSERGEIRVDGAKIVKRVLADLDRAVRTDPDLARDQGRSPVDAKVVRGLVEAFAQIRGKAFIGRR